MQMRVRCYAVASKPRCIATVMGLTFSSRATLNLEVGIRVERWHDSLYIRPETERGSRQSCDSSDNSGDYQRNARFASDQKVTDDFRIGAFFASFLAPVEKLSHDFSSLTGRRCYIRAVIIGGLSPLSQNIITPSYV